MKGKKSMEELVETQLGINSDWVLVRPADGPLTKTYATGDFSGYSISRKDLAHFVCTRCLVGDEWNHKRPVVVYK
jgi:hypothetical protein